VLSDSLARQLNQTVIVDNRGGAGGSIGMAEVAKAAPDGLTLGMATLSTHGVNPAVFQKLPYDPLKDFAAITEVVKAPGVLVINAKLPVKNMAEFIKYLKANPGKVSYASPGNGTIGHMWAEMFKSTTNTFMVHIPYRGAGPALNDVVAGQVMVYFDQVASSLPHIQSGKLHALAVSWNKRLDVLPLVPTYAQVSLFSNNDPSWFGLVAPRGTPQPIIRRLHLATVNALREPSVRERLSGLGLYASGSTPEEFEGQIRKEIDKMQRISKFARITLD
jgi:tripartite-type tricarboxylate transporter receptor subunit TctC